MNGNFVSNIVSQIPTMKDNSISNIIPKQTNNEWEFCIKYCITNPDNERELYIK